MTKNEAHILMSAYADYLENSVDIHALRPHNRDRVAHLIGMPTRVTDKFSSDKTMRWLGYMQGQLEAMSIFTLSQLKEHSRTKKVL